MNIELKLPVCPLCKAEVRDFKHVDANSAESNDDGLHQRLTFQCYAQVKRSAKHDFKDPSKPYGSWEPWKTVSQCPKATEIALALLAKQP